MKVTFLGTSAANAYPEVFCMCRNCVRARELGGASLRKRSSALINDDLLIDLGPDIMSASQIHGIPLAGVEYCLQTHPHADHLDLSHLLSRSPAYGVVGAPLLRFHASRETLGIADRMFTGFLDSHSLFSPDTGNRLNLEICAIEPFVPVQAGRYRVTPVPARHGNDCGALLFIIESKGGCVFYGTDTAALPEDAWNAFHKLDRRFDLVVLDHTYGPDEECTDHLNAEQVELHAARLRSEGLLSENGRVFATHIAHEGNPPHPELREYSRLRGYEIAYDGLVLEI